MEIGKPEYSDLYKFVTSIGALLIFSSILIPWLFLQNPSEFPTNSWDISIITPIAQELINTRLEMVLWITRNLPWISGFIASTGVAFFVLGLYKWHKRQLTRDDLEELEKERRRKDLIKDSTPQDRVEKSIEEETGEQKPVIGSPLTETILNTIIRNQQIERKVIDGIGKCYGFEKLRSEIKIGQLVVDLMLELSHDKTILFEIAYASDLGQLRNKLNKMSETLSEAKNSLEIVDNSTEILLKAVIVVGFDSENLLLQAKNWIEAFLTSKNVILLTIEQVDRLDLDCCYLKNLIEM